VKISLLALRLMIAVAILPVLLVFGLLLVLYQRPLPRLEYPGFESCSLPCWGGILPGQTRALDSPQVMAAHLVGAELEFNQVSAQINFEVTGLEQQVNGSIYDDRGLVGSLRIMMRMPLWRLIMTLGTPECVSSQTYPDGGELVSLWWVQGDYTISSGVILPPPPVWNAAVEVFVLSIFGNTGICDTADVKRWQGFAPLWFYRSSRAG
jgi:hypothetical protein